MTELAKEQCHACRSDASPLNAEQMSELHDEVPHWEIINAEGVPQIRRSFEFSNFAEAMAFARRVGDLAEVHQHHPALLVEWGKVTVTWWTHKIKGLHRNDIVMAAKTDRLLEEPVTCG